MYYLGVDVGGTKTAVAISDERGQILSYKIGNGANYQSCGSEESFFRLSSTIIGACHQIGITKEDIDYSFLGIAGVDHEHDIVVIRRILEKLELRHYAFENDGLIALRSGTIDGKGILITCGTGSISFGSDGKKTIRKGGFTWFFGERLGSFFVAGLVASAIMRGKDGRGKRTIMERLLWEDFSVTIEEMMKKNLPDVEYYGPDPIITLIQVLYKAARQNDCCALEILSIITNEIINIVSAFNQELNLPEKTKIVLEGTVFKKADTILYDMIKAGLGKNYDISIPQYDPVIGAVMLALEEGQINMNDMIIKQMIDSYNGIQKGEL